MVMSPALVTVESLDTGTYDSPYLDLRERPWGRSSRIQVDGVRRELQGAY
jgi:hypothetical protein